MSEIHQPDTERWYACYTRARHEKRVQALLVESGMESFLPLVPRTAQWKDRRKVVDWPMFPSYVFARIRADALHRLLGIPGVAEVVSADGRPLPIADREIENVRRFARALRSEPVPVESRPFLAEGDVVEVIGGPFVGVRGVVVQRRGRRRVLIGLEAIGQALELNLDERLLQTVPAVKTGPGGLRP
jgi:transcription antitermination factor NusG